MELKTGRWLAVICLAYAGAAAAVVLWSSRATPLPARSASAAALLGLAAIAAVAVLLRLRGPALAAAAASGDASAVKVNRGPRPGNPLHRVLSSDLNEQDARRELQQLDRALEVGVVITDGSGHPRLVGERARQLLGLPLAGDVREQVAGVLEEVRGDLERVAATKQSKATSLEVRLDGAAQGLEITMLPLDDGDDAQVVVQLRDRSQLQALEQNLLGAARLRGLTRLYLGVAHDLRAPINAITLNLANIKDSMFELTEVPQLAEHRQTIEMLEDELRRLQRAVESLLEQTAPISLDPTTFDLRRLIEDLEFLLRAQARQQRVAFEITLPSEPVIIMAQRDSIKQAVLNLVVNAFDATEKTGRVTIEVDRSGDRVRIVVSDTGAGVPVEVIPRLFELHATGKSSGTGIGLYVARKAAEAAGGALTLLHTGPGGTAFEILLPLANEDRLGHQA